MVLWNGLKIQQDPDVGSDGTGGQFGIVPGQAVDVFIDATAKKQSAPGPEKR